MNSCAGCWTTKLAMQPCQYNEIARNAWDILMAASQLSDDKRVYILGHTQEDDNGRIKAKTIGKLLDEKITIEGLLTIVLRTAVINGQYLFSTQNNGLDTVKSPLGLFDSDQIENDLAAVDAAIFPITNSQNPPDFLTTRKAPCTNLTPTPHAKQTASAPTSLNPENTSAHSHALKNL